jgi:hypothetical protein
VLDVSLELLLERFATVFDAYREAGTTFDLECHPGERAMGDLESAGDYIRSLERAGDASDVVGFNLDPSYMVWQGVSCDRGAQGIARSMALPQRSSGR